MAVGPALRPAPETPSLELCKRLAEAAEAKASELRVPIVFAAVDPAIPGQDRYANTHLYDYRHALLCNGLLLFANDSNISAS